MTDQEAQKAAEDDPRGFLTRLADKRSENVPVVIGGARYFMRSVLRVGDVGELPPHFSQMDVRTQAVTLFAILGLTPKKQPLITETAGEEWFHGADAIEVAQAVLDSRVMEKLFPRRRREDDEGIAGESRRPSRGGCQRGRRLQHLHRGSRGVALRRLSEVGEGP